MATHNLSKWTRQILRRHSKDKKQPSLTLHLYTSHFRFEQQNGVFLFESPMKCFLEYVREQRLPSELLDILDQAKVPFYEGCLVVQVHDHRATPAGKMKKPGYIPTAEQTPIWSSRATSETSNAETGPEIYRIVLGPSTETLWSDLAQLSDSADLGWTLDSEQDALEMEAKILALTQPNLCLDPNFEVTRLANSVLRATTLECPEAGSGDRVAGRRGDRCSSPSEDEEQRTEAEHFMMMMDEGYGRAFAPTFSRMNFIQAANAEKAKAEAAKPKEVKPANPGQSVVHPSHAQALQQQQNQVQRAQHPLAQSHLAPALQQAVNLGGSLRSATKRSFDEAGSPVDSTAAPAKKKPGRPAKIKDAGSPPAPVAEPPKRKNARQPKPRKASGAEVIPILTPPASVLQPPPLLPPNAAQPANPPLPAQMPMYNSNPLLGNAAQAMSMAAPQAAMHQQARGMVSQVNYQAMQAAIQQQQGISSMPNMPNMQPNPALMQYGFQSPHHQQMMLQGALAAAGIPQPQSWSNGFPQQMPQ